LIRAIFLDRDGVINRKAPEGEYIASWNEIEFLPRVFDAVVALQQAGFLILIVTNQRGVATGKVREADLNEIHRRMRMEFAEAGARISDIYCCMHNLGAGCSCRKPKPGMLLEAKDQHNLDLAESWMIGDSPSDIQAGLTAGCKTAQIIDQDLPRTGIVRADIEAVDLGMAAEKILLRDKKKRS
jgi:D-glycero-D-manno-heptose 1,7-bisphosphate phosphatase